MISHESTKARSEGHFFRVFVLAWIIGGAAAPSLAQTRLAVLQAEDHRAATAAELAVIRSGSHSSDPLIARVAVRALGRLERPALVADIVPLLKHAASEVRAEAANAVGQAAQGWKREKAPNGALDAAAAALTARLKIEGDPDVRAALAETIGRLPYSAADQAERAEQTLVDFDARAESVTDRLGVAKGFEALVRITRKMRGPGPDAVTVLRRLAIPGGADATSGARIRRLALEALQSAAALDDDLVTKAMRDPDAQARRIVMRAAPVSVLLTAVHDSSASVRLEALRQLKAKGAEDTCEASLAAVSDRETAVALVALDQLSGCMGSGAALAALDHAVTDLSEAGSARGWHRAAHALVALAAASPERGAAVLGQFTGSRVWQLRMYAARAAATLHDREALEKLASDEDDNVREAAVESLAALFAHDADKIFVAELARSGHQVLRAAAAALSGTPDREAAIPALRTTLDRLVAEGSDNSHDARDAIIKTLTGLGAPAGAKTGRRVNVADTQLDADDLRRLAAPRARVAVRGVGTFELALFTDQAPATVLRFAKLAESGYYNGLTFHRVVPNFVVQGGSPGANEYIGEARFMRDELGLWPHVRGAVGISTRGRDTGDAQIFIDLVDNPRLDHEYTVFAQILNGIEVVDRILEGDVIDRIEIVETVL